MCDMLSFLAKMKSMKYCNIEVNSRVQVHQTSRPLRCLLCQQPVTGAPYVLGSQHPSFLCAILGSARAGNHTR